MLLVNIVPSIIWYCNLNLVPFCEGPYTAKLQLWREHQFKLSITVCLEVMLNYSPKFQWKTQIELRAVFVTILYFQSVLKNKNMIQLE